ncbi:MAG: hypothetical protein AB8B79_19625 [Granulosicoccus sp.]
MSAARISNRPVFVLRELVDSMRLNQIVLPGQTYLQNLVRRALALLGVTGGLKAQSN